MNANREIYNKYRDTPEFEELVERGYNYCIHHRSNITREIMEELIGKKFEEFSVMDHDIYNVISSRLDYYYEIFNPRR